MGEGPLWQKRNGFGRWAAGLAVGKVALPNVCYWENSGKHLLAMRFSVFDFSDILA